MAIGRIGPQSKIEGLFWQIGKRVIHAYFVRLISRMAEAATISYRDKEYWIRFSERSLGIKSEKAKE
jgi:hypothetical protein